MMIRSCRSRIPANSVKLVEGATLKAYPGYPHGMLIIHADVINEDLLALIKR